MKRIGAILVILLFSGSAFAQQSGPRSLAGQTNPVAEQPPAQAQLERSVAQLYLSLVRSEVELTDEQFLKAAPVIQRFIRQKFENATQRGLLDKRQEELLSQPDAPDADFQKLNEEATRLGNENSTWDTRMVRQLQGAMTNRQLQLSDRQVVALRNFNRKFFNEKLPTVLEQMRQQQGTGTATRRNQQQNGKDPSQPGNTLRGKEIPPAQPPRPKLSR